ncbi:hypothetical protein MMC17_003467 [Xylographa soralifera]|nr:hypothetical protein [Xylographa soralifera]
MVSDKIYELCLPVLMDSALEEEEKTDKLEELLRKERTLTGRLLEDAILGALWRYRDVTNPPPASPPARPGLARRGSPAPWQVPRASTPLASPPLSGVSPAPGPGYGIAPPAFTRAKSSTASPFTSPRPSPRLAFASHIPHSPNLNSYEFSEKTAQTTDYGDYGSDTVDWLVSDDSPSRPSSSGAGSNQESVLSGAAAAWIQPQQTDMSPYDMLRSILGDGKSDEEIEAALESNAYDLSSTIMTLMGHQALFGDQEALPSSEGQILIGKSMIPSEPITINQHNPGRSNVICKYWLSTGSCLRADCRFSHDLSSHICKYWIMGNCLAGDTCVFSHDPAALISNLNIDNGNPMIATPPTQNIHPSFQVQDYDAFPTLQPAAMNEWAQASSFPSSYNTYNFSGSQSVRNYTPTFSNYSEGRGGPPTLLNDTASTRSYGSRPTSRHSSRAPTPSIPSVDDTEAFPTLGSATAKGVKKHHGKRGGHGHNHGSKENIPNSLADLVRMSPSPVPGLLRKGLMKTRSYTGSRENSAAAMAIPPPEHIPWLETGDKANQAYIKARQEAFKHGGLRNKFLQSAAQAWNRNDARAAKALSLRGQSENDLMRRSHREAADLLYKSRNSSSGNNNSELYIDLHGLHPEEAVEYLERVLLEQQKSARPVYAITGTGHHSKNGKDKVGKAIRGWLVEWKYLFREFSVPGDRGNVGGILGIDARSFDKVLVDGRRVAEVETKAEEAPSIGHEKIQVAKEVPTGPKAKG